MPSTAPLAAPPLRSDDVERCRAILAEGSRSFHAASMLLPRRLRGPAAAVYAFCREADDAVDEAADPARGVRVVEGRLDRIYAGTPDDDPVDRAFAEVVRHHGIPRVIPDALVEGFVWDAGDRVYETLSDTRAYGVRVASTVGLMMTLVMGVRDHAVLARAADLGVAMQLTNIARDVGEDARRGRVYLPSAWLVEAGIDRRSLIEAPAHSPALATVVERLLSEADRLYARADAGIPHLPGDCRVAIRAASVIYADIGRVVRARGCDAVSGRAYTSTLRKVQLGFGALGARLWRLQPVGDPVLPEAESLIAAV